MRHQAGDAIDRKDKQRGQRQNAANQRSIQSQDCGLLQDPRQLSMAKQSAKICESD